MLKPSPAVRRKISVPAVLITAIIEAQNMFSDPPEGVPAMNPRLFFASDEFYLKCGRPLPEDEYYGEYCQIENGVGMLTSFGVEFSSIFKTLDDDEKRVKREISVATGEAAYDFIRNLTEKLTAECPDLTVHVYPVKNNFFGEKITVAGLVTLVAVLPLTPGSVAITFISTKVGGSTAKTLPL